MAPLPAYARARPGVPRHRSARSFAAGVLLCLVQARGATAQPVPAEPAPPTAQPPASDANESSAPTPPAPAPPAPPGLSEADGFTELEAALERDGQAAPSVAPASPAPAPARFGIQSLNPDLSLILDAAGAWFSEEENLQTGGHDPTHTGFNLQQLELAAGASVDPYFRFDANIVFSQFGVEIEEAYGTTLDLPFGLQSRFGQFLTSFGRINATHPHTWDFVDQPFAIGRVFGGEGNRGLGLELSWLSPLPWSAELVLSTTEAAGAATARSFYGPDDLGVHGLEDLLYVAAVEQFFPLSDDWSLLFGVSGAFGPNGTGPDNHTDVYGVDLYLKYRPIMRESTFSATLQTEWLYRRRQIPDDLLEDANGYAQLVVRFLEHWGLGTRYEFGSPSYGRNGEPSLEDPLDPEWIEPRHRVTANVTYWPTEFSRLRLQVSRDLPEWREPVSAVFLAVELVTGAHGSHTF